MSVTVASLLVLVISGAFKPLPPGPSINGNAAISPAYMNGQVQNFAFSARKNASGAVSGNFESSSPGQDIRVHGNITCFTILADGKTAVFSGVVTQRAGTGLPGLYNVGDPIWGKMVDNGEGANAPADQFSDYFPSAFGCNNANIGLFNLTNGNIQVKP